MARYRNRLWCALFLILISWLFTSCQELDPPFEERTYWDELYFSLDQETILSRLANGQNDFFRRLSTLPEGTPLVPEKQVNWSQSDYLQIARAYHEYAWGESMDKWGFGSLFYRMLCSDVSQGPQEGSLWLIKIANKNRNKILYVSMVNIEPWRKAIRMYKEEYDPMIQRLKSHNLADYKMTVEEALRIAEENGGSQARMSVENNCNITLSLSPGSQYYNGWQVIYQKKDRRDLININIDPKTGQFKIIYPKSK